LNSAQLLIAFTVAEVANALRCSPLFLVKDAKRGLLVIREINNRTRIILPHDLADYLERKRLFKSESAQPGGHHHKPEDLLAVVPTGEEK
jgi:hypothetical protein